MALWPSLSVCLSVRNRCSIKRDERINLVFGMGLLSTSPTLCFKEIRVSVKVSIPYKSYPIRKKSKDRLLLPI